MNSARDAPKKQKNTPVHVLKKKKKKKKRKTLKRRRRSVSAVVPERVLGLRLVKQFQSALFHNTIFLNFTLFLVYCLFFPLRISFSKSKKLVVPTQQ